MTEDVTPSPFPALPDDPDAYDVVGAFAAAQDARPDDHTLLRRWTQRFPQFADDLIAFGYARASFGWSLADPVETEEAGPAKEPLTDLVAAAQPRGLTGPGLAQALGLQRHVLASLNQRVLDAAGLPRSLAARIAAALGRTSEEVSAYLRQPPRLAAGAHYKSKQAPSLVAEARPRQTFADALRAGGALSEEDRAAWLEEIERGEVLGDD